MMQQLQLRHAEQANAAAFASSALAWNSPKALQLHVNDATA
jgi:hypothetical protein